MQGAKLKHHTVEIGDPRHLESVHNYYSKTLIEMKPEGLKTMLCGTSRVPVFEDVLSGVANQTLKQLPR